MRTILLISNGALCRNPRVLKEAETLGRGGYEVTVLTVRNHASAEKSDAAIMLTATFKRVTVDTLPDLGQGKLRPFARRLHQWFARQLAAKVGLKTIHALGPATELLRRARQIPADLVIVHNEVPHWVGTRLLRSGRRVAADIEDWHSEDLLPQDRVARPLALIRSVESILLHDACYTTTTSHALAAAMHSRYGGRKPEVITNSFPLQPDPLAGRNNPEPVFFWFSQTIGPGRGLEQFFRAWAQTEFPSKVVLLGEAMGTFCQDLVATLPAGYQARVSVLPLVPPDQLASVIARYDIGLALEDPAIANRDLTITNKIIQYLNAGLAVFASNTAGQREVLANSPDAGVVVELGEAGALAAAIVRIASDPVALAARQQAARRLAENIYCWERESARLVAIVAAGLEH